MIGQKGNCFALPPSAFKQLRVKRLLLFDLMKKKLIGFVIYNVVWILYEEGNEMFKVPIARNMKWYEAIKSELEFAVLEELKQIYIV